MVSKSLIFLIILCCYSKISYSQKVDTVYITGYFISYATKQSLNNSKKQTDIIWNYIFINEGNDSMILKPKFKDINSIKYNRDSLFLICGGGDFVSLNELYFKNKITHTKYNSLFFPNKDSFTYKDKKYLYKATLVKVRCLKILLTEPQLINIIPFEYYHFHNNQIPVFIIDEMVPN